MTHSIWEELCTLPAQVAAPTEENGGEQGQQVSDRTTLVHQTLELVLSNLNRRVLTLSGGANLDAAIDDAQKIKHIWPTLALGYVHEATIYSEQGRQRHVINICNQALGVVDTRDTHYALLQRLRQDAVQRQNIRIDFIEKLPFDIVSTTLIRMFMDGEELLDSLTPCPYLYVSRVWRDCIIECLGGLRFRTGRIEMENLEAWSQISIFARHVKTLHVSRYSKDTWLSELLRRNDFCMLQELIIDSFCTTSMDDFVSSLGSIGSTLTHFQMHGADLQPYGSVPPITGVLLACPNLVSLTLYQPNDTYLCDLPDMTWPKLTTLVIVNATEAFDCDEIRAICEHFPSLKEFSIDPCPDLQAIPVIQKYYPWMRSLQVVAVFPGVHLWCSDQGPECEEPGITELVISMGEWDPDEPLSDLNLVFKQHHRTLESIRLRIDADIDDPSMYDIKFPRLKTLHLYNSGWWIPGNAPMLQVLQIASNTFTTTPAVFDTIPPNLKILRLNHVDGSQHDDKSPIVQYLHRFIDHPHLQELAIHTINMTTMTHILDAVCRLRQLESLFFMYQEWDPKPMETFYQKLCSGCPRLTSIYLDCIKAPSTASMLALKRLASLKQITFSMVSPVVEDGFWETVLTLQQLDNVVIDPSKGVTKYDMYRVKELIPDFHVIVR